MRFGWGGLASVLLPSPRVLNATDIPIWANLLDTTLLKGRAGEAFVENVFRQSGYRVSRVGRESHVQHLLKTGKAEFLPDFLVWKPVAQEPGGPPLHRLFCVEVKYRSDVEAFLRRFEGSPMSEASAQWPELKVVIVTDRPKDGRACFQLLDLARQTPGTPLHTIDLHEAEDLAVSQTAVKEHEELVRSVFTLLAERSRPPRRPTRKPPVKAASFLLAFLASFLV